MNAWHVRSERWMLTGSSGLTDSLPYFPSVLFAASYLALYKDVILLLGYVVASRRAPGVRRL